MTLPALTTTLQTWNPRITGVLSAIGSSAIIYIIISDRSRKLMKPKNRLMLGMSIFDCVQSLAMVISSAGAGHSGICQFQGICLWLGLAVPLYNSSLNLFYLLVIRYNADPQYFSTKIEPYAHAVSILYPLTLAITTAILGQITSLDGLCFTVGSLLIFGWGIPVFLSILFCIFSMTGIYLAVRKQAESMSKFSYNTANSNIELKETRNQALLYSSAFILTFIFQFIEGFIRSEETILNIVVILNLTFYPLQGFWNFLFYIMPGVKHVRNINPAISTFGAIREVVFNASSVAESFRRSPRATRKSNRFVPSSPKTCFKREGKCTLPVGNDSENETRTARRVSFALIGHEEAKDDNVSSTTIDVEDNENNTTSLRSIDDGNPISSNAIDNGINGPKVDYTSVRRESLSCISSVLSLVDVEDGEDKSSKRVSCSRRSSAASLISACLIKDDTDVNVPNIHLRSESRELSSFAPNENE